MLFNTESSTVTYIMALHDNNEMTLLTPNMDTLLAFLAIWFSFTTLTYGVSVPAGIFLPGIIIGACIGAIVAI
jgi:H+/Cl- antiporter ClcA